jgi:predicted dehydrogenase
MAKDKSLNVCMIGYRFMGRAHSNAYLKVDKFFDVPIKPVMHTVVGRKADDVSAFASRWGWRTSSTDWKAAVSNPEVDFVDVGTPNNQHRDMTIAALEAGKHVLCEKPLAASIEDARAMVKAAKASKKSKSFVSYSYRRVPAVALAHQLVKQGAIGKLWHIRAWYLQGWAHPSVPLIWRFDKSTAGSGSHGDLGAHIIDMTRFITGDEFQEITGAISETFVKERTIPSGVTGPGIASGTKGGGKKGKVLVDDAVLFLARMKSGAIGTFESTRFATGNENKNGLEINGEKGSLRFNFEDLNYLHFYDNTLPRQVRGWQRIPASVPGVHPYADHWWPTAHPLGYEHTFINQTYDILQAIAGKKPTVPLADFDEAWKTQQVLYASMQAAKEKCAMKVSEITL